jgi:hypothetical protein
VAAPRSTRRRRTREAARAHQRRQLGRDPRGHRGTDSGLLLDHEDSGVHHPRPGQLIDRLAAGLERRWTRSTAQDSPQVQTQLPDWRRPVVVDLAESYAGAGEARGPSQLVGVAVAHCCVQLDTAAVRGATASGGRVGHANDHECIVAHPRPAPRGCSRCPAGPCKRPRPSPGCRTLLGHRPDPSAVVPGANAGQSLLGLRPRASGGAAPRELLARRGGRRELAAASCARGRAAGRAVRWHHRRLDRLSQHRDGIRGGLSRRGAADRRGSFSLVRYGQPAGPVLAPNPGGCPGEPAGARHRAGGPPHHRELLAVRRRAGVRARRGGCGAGSAGPEHSGVAQASRSGETAGALSTALIRVQSRGARPAAESRLIELLWGVAALRLNRRRRPRRAAPGPR